MPQEYDNDLLKEGILNFKSKDYATARRYFERALDVADDLQTRAQANFYMSQLVEDPARKRKFLEETLAIDMGHAAARRALAILDGKLKPADIVNPDAIPAPLPGPQAAQADRFTCPKCGGRLLYAPDGAALVCENCSRQQNLNAAIPAADQDFFVAMANGRGFRKTISVKTFQCQGCAANFLLAPSELSATCAYCGSVHVIALKNTRELVEPDAVVPMAFDQEKATIQWVHWLEKNRIKPQGHPDSPRGLYLPVWAFDLIGNIPWSGRVIRDKREVPISAETPALFNDVCVPASSRLAGWMTRLLPEYSLAAAPAYDPRYLAGWPAQVYELAMSDAALEARRLSVEQVRRDIHAGHGNVIDLRYSTSNISITSYRLILLPVWVTAYQFEDNSCQGIINGQTGSVHGDTPGLAMQGFLEDLLGT